MVRRVSLVLLIAVLLVPFLMHRAQSGSPSNITELPAQKLILVSPHSEGVRTEFARAFSDWTAKNRGYQTQFEWLDVGGTSEGIRYVKSEFARKPDGIDVDLFFGGGMDPYFQFKAANLLQVCTVPSNILSEIQGDLDGVELYDPDHYWFGTCLGAFGIIYNKRVFEWLHIPEPTTWSDLADPRLYSWVGSGDPRSSGSIHMAYEVILQADGWELGWSNLLAMCANTRNFSRSAAEVPKDTALGEVACGTAVDVYAWRQIAESGDRMRYVLPKGRTIIGPDCIAVLKGAPHAELAADFIAFALSESGQKLWYMKKGTPDGPVEFELSRMPILAGRVAKAGDQASVRMDPFANRGAYFTYNPTLGSQRWGILNDLIGACMIDTLPELRAAWLHVQSSNASPHAIQTLLTPPLAASNLSTLADSQWNDPAFRSKTKAAWSEAARTRYQAATEL